MKYYLISRCMWLIIMVLTGGIVVAGMDFAAIHVDEAVWPYSRFYGLRRCGRIAGLGDGKGNRDGRGCYACLDWSHGRLIEWCMCACLSACLEFTLSGTHVLLRDLDVPTCTGRCSLVQLLVVRHRCGVRRCDLPLLVERTLVHVDLFLWSSCP